MLRSFFAREEGQGLVEYALILMFMVLIIIGALTVLGLQISGSLYDEIISSIEGLNN